MGVSFCLLSYTNLLSYVKFRKGIINDVGDMRMEMLIRSFTELVLQNGQISILQCGMRRSVVGRLVEI